MQNSAICDLTHRHHCITVNNLNLLTSGVKHVFVHYSLFLFLLSLSWLRQNTALTVFHSIAPIYQWAFQKMLDAFAGYYSWADQ